MLDFNSAGSTAPRKNLRFLCFHATTGKSACVVLLVCCHGRCVGCAAALSYPAENLAHFRISVRRSQLRELRAAKDGLEVALSDAEDRADSAEAAAHDLKSQLRVRSKALMFRTMARCASGLQCECYAD